MKLSDVVDPIRKACATRDHLSLPAEQWNGRGVSRQLFEYGLALVASALAVALMALGGSYLSKAPFVVYFVAVLVSAFFGGWRSGLAATVITTGCAVFIIGPPDALWHFEDTIPMATYMGACLLMIYLMTRAQIAGTKRQQAEGELEQFNKDLELRIKERTAAWEQANADLEAFAYSISHDLRTPLRAIDGYTRILRDDYGKEMAPKALAFLESVCVNATRMGQMINDLLTFSRLNRKQFSKGLVDMRNLAQAVCQELLILEPARQVQLTVQELPKCSGDDALLRQVLTNLISNALKFTRRAPVAVIEIGAQGSPGEIVYYVRDNGVGFDPNYAHKLFKVFQRLHKVEDFEGTGVGLSIVQRIIQRHGGRVWSEGKPNAGACFYFTLPVDAPLPAGEGTNPQPSTAQGVRPEPVLQDT